MAKTPTNDTDLNIEDIAQDITRVLSDIEWQTWGAATLYIILGYFIARFASKLVGRAIENHTSAHYTLIVKRLCYYGIIVVSVIFALTTLNLNIQALGIATVLTLAIGFASQTAVSNIISSLFLVFGRPFSVGDHIEYNGIIGELMSIDLLSIKIRTFNNSLVRIPNELLLKNQLINLTRFSNRRLDLRMSLSLSEDFDRIRNLLLELARNNNLVLQTPPPQLQYFAFTESLLIVEFSTWVKKESFYVLKHSLPFEIQRTLKAHDIKLPSMHVVLEKTTAE